MTCSGCQVNKKVHNHTHVLCRGMWQIYYSLLWCSFALTHTHTHIYILFLLSITEMLKETKPLQYVFFSPRGHHFPPSRHAAAVCLEWVTGSRAPFNFCLLVKISTISVCHMDETSEETTKDVQKAEGGLFSLWLIIHLLPVDSDTFLRFPLRLSFKHRCAQTSIKANKDSPIMI